MKIPIGIPGDTLLVDGGLNPLSLAIKRRTLSDWSHCARIVAPEFVERFLIKHRNLSRFVKSDLRWKGVPLVEALGGGVQVTDSYKYAGVAWRVRTPVKSLGPIELSAMNEFLEAQIGKGYDWGQVLFGMLMRRPEREESDRWFCSELQAATDLAMGRSVIADTAASLIPPHLYAASVALQTTDWYKRQPYGWNP